ncbi:hypothetical protein D3C85_1252810 [compost metagenome]
MTVLRWVNRNPFGPVSSLEVVLGTSVRTPSQHVGVAFTNNPIGHQLTLVNHHRPQRTSLGEVTVWGLGDFQLFTIHIDVVVVDHDQERLREGEQLGDDIVTEELFQCDLVVVPVLDSHQWANGLKVDSLLYVEVPIDEHLVTQIDREAFLTDTFQCSTPR